MPFVNSFSILLCCMFLALFIARNLSALLFHFTNFYCYFLIIIASVECCRLFTDYSLLITFSSTLLMRGLCCVHFVLKRSRSVIIIFWLEPFCSFHSFFYSFTNTAQHTKLNGSGLLFLLLSIVEEDKQLLSSTWFAHRKFYNGYAKLK